MRTVDPTWRNLAKGYRTIRAQERSLRATLEPKIRQAQQQRYQATLAAWNSRHEQRCGEHQRALASWTGTMSEHQALLWDEARVGARRARVIVPATTVAFLLIALLGDSAGTAVRLVVLGAGIGLAISFATALPPALRWAQVRLDRPVLDVTSDPKPRPEQPISLRIVDRWWEQIGDNGHHRGDDGLPDYGDEGEDSFYWRLSRALPDDHIGTRGLLVKANLDVDVLVVGPTNIWVFEVKHWTGTISHRNGSWWRSKTYYEPGGNPVRKDEQLKPFDRQWIRESREVGRTLRRRVEPPGLADQIAGGLVFSHPNVRLDIHQPGCGWGTMDFWTDQLRHTACNQHQTIAEQTRLRILDALLDRAESLDHRYPQRRSCVELADQLAARTRSWAIGYLASQQ